MVYRTIWERLWMSSCLVRVVAKLQYFRVRTLVAGGEFGSGKRGGGVSTLLVGVLDDRYPVGQDGPK